MKYMKLCGPFMGTAAFFISHAAYIDKWLFIHIAVIITRESHPGNNHSKTVLTLSTISQQNLYCPRSMEIMPLVASICLFVIALLFEPFDFSQVQEKPILQIPVPGQASCNGQSFLNQLDYYLARARILSQILARLAKLSAGFVWACTSTGTGGPCSLGFSSAVTLVLNHHKMVSSIIAFARHCWPLGLLTHYCILGYICDLW